jgi:hypothetical protein
VTKARQRERARRRLLTQGPFRPTPGWAYFHGSKSGLPPGTILLPPRERDDRRSELSNIRAGFDQFADHPDWVFVSTCPYIALGFAGRRPKPALYEVAIEGAVEEDEDDRGRSWKCRRARIVRQVPLRDQTVAGTHLRRRSRGLTSEIIGFG